MDKGTDSKHCLSSFSLTMCSKPQTDFKFHAKKGVLHPWNEMWKPNWNPSNKNKKLFCLGHPMSSCLRALRLMGIWLFPLRLARILAGISLGPTLRFHSWECRKGVDTTIVRALMLVPTCLSAANPLGAELPTKQLGWTGRPAESWEPKLAAGCCTRWALSERHPAFGQAGIITCNHNWGGGVHLISTQWGVNCHPHPKLLIIMEPGRAQKSRVFFVNFIQVLPEESLPPWLCPGYTSSVNKKIKVTNCPRSCQLYTFWAFPSPCHQAHPCPSLLFLYKAHWKYQWTPLLKFCHWVESKRCSPRGRTTSPEGNTAKWLLAWYSLMWICWGSLLSLK